MVAGSRRIRAFNVTEDFGREAVHIASDARIGPWGALRVFEHPHPERHCRRPCARAKVARSSWARRQYSGRRGMERRSAARPDEPNQIDRIVHYDRTRLALPKRSMSTGPSVPMMRAPRSGGTSSTTTNAKRPRRARYRTAVHNGSPRRIIRFGM